MSVATAPTDPSDLVSCVDTVNALFACGGPAHQFDRYYKDGALDGCAGPLAELHLCLRLKAGDASDRRAAVRELLRERASPTLNVVWPAAASSAAGAMR